MAERMAKLKVGRGTELDVDIGPLIDDRQRNIVEELVQDAVQKGASCCAVVSPWGARPCAARCSPVQEGGGGGGGAWSSEEGVCFSLRDWVIAQHLFFFFFFFFFFF